MGLELNDLEKDLEAKLLIKNTTKEEREKIVKKGIAFANLDSETPSEEILPYLDYIEGRKELREVVESILDQALDDEREI